MSSSAILPMIILQAMNPLSLFSRKEGGSTLTMPIRVARPSRGGTRTICVFPKGILVVVLVMLWVLGAAGTIQAQAPAGDALDPEAVARGEYLFRATGGCGCHTDYAGGGEPLAGGRAIKTPFGAFYSTNITPHPDTGLGRWSEADFIRAMREGKGPDGMRYFPVFPYTSFTAMSDGDLKYLWAYLRSVPPVALANRPHEAWPPFGWRIGLPFWQGLYLQSGPLAPRPERSPAWNRGAYLTRALGHCAECHTPRGWLGGPVKDMHLAGAVDGPEGEPASNLTPDRDTGLGSWSEADLVWYFEMGLRPDGDDSQGLMAEMIEHGFQHLAEEDRRAIAVYLASLPPLRNEVLRRN